MYLSFLLAISCVGCYLATAAPQHRISTLHHSADELNPKLLQFIHRLLYTLENDYQDPNWPRNLQPKPTPILSDDCSKEENPSIDHDCDDDGDYFDEKKYKDQVDMYGVSNDNPNHVCDEAYLCDSNKHSESESKLQQATMKSSEINRKERSGFSINYENKKPKMIITSQNTHSGSSQAKPEDRRNLEELIHKRLTDLHLPRIQINQFGTNKVEQNLYHQLKKTGYRNKKQKDEMHKKFAGYREVMNVQPHQVGKGKLFAYDDEERDQRVGKTEGTRSTTNNKHTKNTFYNEFRRDEPSPVITATQSNIKYSDVDINMGLNKNIQGKINEQHKQSNPPIVAQQHKNSISTKEPVQFIRANLPQAADKPKHDDIPKVLSQPKVADQHERPDQQKIPYFTKVTPQSQVSELPNVSDQPKVPDQPKIITGDITKATTDHTLHLLRTSTEDLSTQTDMMDKEKTAKNNITPATTVTTVSAIDDSAAINPEDATGQRSKRTEETSRNISRRNKADDITPTIGPPRDQDAEGSHYNPLSSYGVSDDRRRQKLMYPELRHGVPIAYESNPGASALSFQPNYYNPEYAKHLQRTAKSPSSSFFKASNDRFTTIQHDMDYDDYGQVFYPSRYRFNAPAATVNWNSRHMTMQEKLGRSIPNYSYRFAKQPRFEEEQSIFEPHDFEEPELTAGWEDWEPSYKNVRTVVRDHHSYNPYFI